MKDSSKKIIIAISIIAIIAIIVGICIFAFKPQAKDDNNSNAENTTVVEKNTLDKITDMENKIQQKEAERDSISNEIDQMYKDLVGLYSTYSNEEASQTQN